MAGKQIEFPEPQRHSRMAERACVAIALALVVIVVIINNV